MRHWEDLAWRVQDDTENVLLARARWLRETTGARNLCIAGGVGLNCVANGRIAREAGFDNVWIQPAAGDDGIAIGCAYYGHLEIAEEAAHIRHRPRLLRPQPTATTDIDNATGDAVFRLETKVTDRERHLPRHREACWPKATSSAGSRAAPSSARARSATAASSPIRARPR